MSRKEVAVGAGYCCTPLAAAPLSQGESVDLAHAFKALSDPVRLRLLSLIASFPGGEACVCEVSEAFDLTGPTISHHLRVLRESGLVTSDRRGTWIYYRVAPGRLAALSSLLQIPTTEVQQGAAALTSRS